MQYWVHGKPEKVDLMKRVYGVRVKQGFGTRKYRAWCVCPGKGKVWRDADGEGEALLALKRAVEAEGFEWPEGAFPGYGL